MRCMTLNDRSAVAVETDRQRQINQLLRGEIPGHCHTVWPAGMWSEEAAFGGHQWSQESTFLMDNQ